MTRGESGVPLGDTILSNAPLAPPIPLLRNAKRAPIHRMRRPPGVPC